MPDGCASKFVEGVQIEPAILNRAVPLEVKLERAGVIHHVTTGIIVQGKRWRDGGCEQGGTDDERCEAERSHVQWLLRVG